MPISSMGCKRQTLSFLHKTTTKLKIKVMETTALNLLVVLTVVCYTILAIFGVKDLRRYLKEVKYYEYTNFEPEAPVVGFIFLILTCVFLGGLLVNL